MLRIVTKKENGKVAIVFILETAEIKERFSNFFSAFRKKFSSLKLKIHLIFRILTAKPEAISLVKEGKENSFSVRWQEKSRVSFSENPLSRPQTKKEKAVKAIASLSIFALICQASMIGAFFAVPSAVLAEGEAQLTVIKEVVGGSASAEDWTIHIDDIIEFSGSESGVTTYLLAGSYQINESGGPDHYALTYEGDCDEEGDLTLEEGESKICILVNEYIPYCGDGNIDEGEECDDGNTEDGDGCSSQCLIEEAEESEEPDCGNGLVEEGEECDWGANNGQPCQPPYEGQCTYCSVDCQEVELIGPYCGDGIRNGDEECDGEDGVAEGQTCSEDCRLESEALCEVPIDVVLIMDTSQSMAEGEQLSRCDWENLEWVPNNTPPFFGSFMCVFHRQEGLSEEECQARDDESHCEAPIYTPGSPSKLDSAKEAAKSFIDNLGPNDQSAMVFFNDFAELVKTLSDNHQTTKATIDDLIPSGATNIGDAIVQGINELSSERANPQANKAMILLTDGKANRPHGPGHGEDPADVAYAEEKAGQAASLGYKIFTIGLGSNDEINETMLQNIAATTSAQYYHAPDGNGLAAIYQEIAWEVCQYGSISGYKYQDLDNSATTTNDWTALAGWTINLFHSPEETEPFMTATTSENGYYIFPGLVDGDYFVQETLKEGWLQVYPVEDFYQLTISEHQNIEEINFANYLPLCGNGILDEGEECDDGNLEAGDGCSALCLIEERGPEEIASEEECLEAGYYWYDEACHGQPAEEEAVSPGPGQLVINEILQNPRAVADSKGEWFEIYNPTDQNIELAGCLIRDEGTNSHLITTSTIIAAKDYLVLATNGNPAENGGITPDYVYSDIILSNGADEIILECNGVEIDRVEYDGGPEFPDPNGASMILAHPSLDNNQGSNWCISISLFGDGDLGTPGAENDACPEIPTASIAGCKYYDENKNNQIDEEEEKLAGWEIVLEKQNGEDWQEIATTTTAIEGGDLGCYLFSGLTEGSYRVRESLSGQENWLQTYPSEPAYWEILLTAGQATSSINFANYLPLCGNGILDEGEECDDGNLEAGDGCSAECLVEEEEEEEEEKEGVPAVGGGGALNPPIPELLIQEESVLVTTTTESQATIVWRTTYVATSQVIYSAEGQPHTLDLTSPPTYGYASSSEEDLEKVLEHSVTIRDLEPETTYYFRTVSHGSLVVSEEYTFITLVAEEVEEIIEEEVSAEEEEIGVEEMEEGIGGPFPPEKGELVEEIPEEVKEEGVVTEEVVVEKEKTFQEILVTEGLLAAIGNIAFPDWKVVFLFILLLPLLVLLFLSRKKKKKNNKRDNRNQIKNSFII